MHSQWSSCWVAYKNAEANRKDTILWQKQVLINPFSTLFSGTLISAFAVFCCGKHDYEKNIVACLYNLLAAILQIATIFLLVGWIWSVRWGILFVQLSGIVYK
jgi:hypothetical protein